MGSVETDSDISMKEAGGENTRFEPRTLEDSTLSTAASSLDSPGNGVGEEEKDVRPSSSSVDNDSVAPNTEAVVKAGDSLSANGTTASGGVQDKDEAMVEEEEELDEDDVDNDLVDECMDYDAFVWEDEEKDYLVFDDDKPPKPLKKTEEQFYGFEKFQILPAVPDTHKFYNFKHLTKNEAEFLKAYQRDVKILEQNLPDGMLVKGYEDRMDLFSAIIVGPVNTPYEGGLFAFDIKLPAEYPHKPPSFYFVSFTRERMNPNLYAHDGKVCVSLLGTWKGSHNCEKWSLESTLLQVLVSIQGLILVPEPYFNEPGFTRDPSNSAIVGESRKYNEMATILMLSSVRDMLEKPPNPWQFEITYMLKTGIPKMITRYEDWLKGDVVEGGEASNATPVPDFPLLPLTADGTTKITKLLEQLKSHHGKYCSI